MGGLIEEVRELLRSASGRIGLLKRSTPFVALIALAIFLSTVDLGDDPQAQSFEGSFWLSFVVWIAVVWVRAGVVRWIRRETRHRDERRQTDSEGAGEPVLVSADGAAPARELPGPSAATMVTRIGEKAAVALAGAATLLMLLLPLGWWSSAELRVRDVPRALPLGSAVAVTPAEHGNPWLVAALTALVVAIAILGASAWRLVTLRGYLYGGTEFVYTFGAGFVRAVAIFGGLTLIPIVAVISAGTDLREDPSWTFTGPVWPVLVVLTWCGFDYVTLQRLHDREAQRPPG